MKNGVIKIQRIFRENKKNNKFEFIYKKDFTQKIIKKRKQELLLSNVNLVKKFFSKKKTTPLQIFSIILDFQIFESSQELTIGDFFNYFSDFFAKLEKKKELWLEIHTTISFLFAISNTFTGYFWGNCEFLYKRFLTSQELNQQKFEELKRIYQREIHEVDFHGEKPKSISSSQNSIAFLFPQSNNNKKMN